MPAKSQFSVNSPGMVLAGKLPITPFHGQPPTHIGFELSSKLDPPEQGEPFWLGRANQPGGRGEVLKAVKVVRA